MLILVVFTLANFFIRLMGNKYLLAEAQNYFADTLIDENYENIDISHINSLGGWISILDDKLNVIYTTNDNELVKYTQRELIELTKGSLQRNGNQIYASSKYFTDKLGNECLGILCLPEKNVEVTTTVINMRGGIKNIILIYIGGILVIMAGYILAVWGLSYYMKRKLTNPIYMLKDAFYEISTGDYTAEVDYNAVSEFVEIKDSFNIMVKKLYNMEEEKKDSYLQRQQLFSDLGHDLKTPTTIIQGYSSAILEGKAKENQLNRYVRIINENASNLGELIDLLLDYTRFEQADFQPTMTHCDLGEYLRRVIIERILIYEENEINLSIDIPEEKIDAEIDLKIFKRAIINLLNNILQHNPPGINALVRLTKDKMIIIADSGNPIQPDIHNRIFEPFVCGDQSRNPDRHNSGLGLSITKKIIELHNGTLYLEQGWQGYTKAFIITLP